jgi:hypothetical protein
MAPDQEKRLEVQDLERALAKLPEEQRLALLPVGMRASGRRNFCHSRRAGGHRPLAAVTRARGNAPVATNIRRESGPRLFSRVASTPPTGEFGATVDPRWLSPPAAVAKEPGQLLFKPVRGSEMIAPINDLLPLNRASSTLADA